MGLEEDEQCILLSFDAKESIFPPFYNKKPDKITFYWILSDFWVHEKPKKGLKKEKMTIEDLNKEFLYFPSASKSSLSSPQPSSPILSNHTKVSFLNYIENIMRKFWMNFIVNADFSVRMIFSNIINYSTIIYRL